jgi:hypothetical protein
MRFAQMSEAIKVKLYKMLRFDMKMKLIFVPLINSTPLNRLYQVLNAPWRGAIVAVDSILNINKQ